MRQFDVGPVFWCEWRRASRERWFYAGRCFVAGGLVAGLAAVCWSASYRFDLTQSNTISMAREWCFKIIVLTQLSMLLLVAPASTAGAFSTEIARGHVFLMLVTGMTPAEIVCGTLFARLLPVLSSVACVVPVLVLSSQLAGISLLDLAHLEIVTAGTAVLGCTLALTLSIGARRLHETLMATYVILLAWVLGSPILFMIGLTSVGHFIPGWLTRWSRDINPYRLLIGPISAAGPYAGTNRGSSSRPRLRLQSFWWRSRPGDCGRRPGGRGRAPSRRLLSRLLTNRPFVSLDSYPVFWRECRLQQPSRWVGLLWRCYIVGAVLFTARSGVGMCDQRAARTVWAGLFNGFQAAVGLLLLSVVTPAALAEDRARGSLEVLLSTPISTRSLVLSKWCAYYRAVPALAFLPAVVALAHATRPRSLARCRAGRWIGAGAGRGRHEPGNRASDLGSPGRPGADSLCDHVGHADRRLDPAGVSPLPGQQLEPRPGLGQPIPGRRSVDDVDGPGFECGLVGARGLGRVLDRHFQWRSDRTAVGGTCLVRPVRRPDRAACSGDASSQSKLDMGNLRKS